VEEVTETWTKSGDLEVIDDERDEGTFIDSDAGSREGNEEETEAVGWQGVEAIGQEDRSEQEPCDR